jgi:hypothetical protein
LPLAQNDSFKYGSLWDIVGTRLLNVINVLKHTQYAGKLWDIIQYYSYDSYLTIPSPNTLKPCWNVWNSGLLLRGLNISEINRDTKCNRAIGL